MITGRVTVLTAVVFSFASDVQAQVTVAERSIMELQELMSSGQATAVSITQAYLDRIEAYDQQGPTINAMVWLNPNARADAEALDRERAERGPRGPLHGIPIILKDNYDTPEMPTAAGTLALANHYAPDDAFQVAKLRAAGAVILGKANMHELASGITTISSLGGQTRNPYDLSRNPGGSSGGTGAAIAASFAAVGWGSDTCGSIRIPAAQNDLVGLRPTKGLSSIDGIIPLAATQDVGGPLARTVRDLAISLDATVGADPNDPATAILQGRDLPRFVDALDTDALRGARVGILEDYFGDAPEEAAAARLVRAAIDQMVELGADTVTVEIPDLSELISGSGVIGFETKWDLIDYFAQTPDAPVSSLGEILESGLVHEALTPRMRARNESEERNSEEYLAALAKRAPLREAVEATLNRHSLDALVFPTVRTIPSVIGDPQRGSSCSLGANTGLPSISVPVGFTSGVPIGMELMARTLEDARLVSMAYAYEQATDHRRVPPTTPTLDNRRAPVRVDLAFRPDEPAGVLPNQVSGLSLQGTSTFDPVTNQLILDVRVVGVDAEDVLGLALRFPQERGGWQVAHLIMRAGEDEALWVGQLSARQREHLDASELHLVVLTKSRPLGAAVFGLQRRR
ncbi:MAG: amidase family protein [Gemmatimonadota bacterium]|nr:amidase family protein [Gemmatimonadota bacterium]MDE3005138.1 amidase family protein [Gemmatimonadota bacterium]MDE3012805.1 amidase family protein [Gemmatimonadota bacterium]